MRRAAPAVASAGALAAMLLDVTPERLQAEWYHVSSVQAPQGIEVLRRAHAVQASSNHIDPVPVAFRSSGKASAPALASSPSTIFTVEVP